MRRVIPDVNEVRNKVIVDFIHVRNVCVFAGKEVDFRRTDCFLACFVVTLSGRRTSLYVKILLLVGNRTKPAFRFDKRGGWAISRIIRETKRFAVRMTK